MRVLPMPASPASRTSARWPVGRLAPAALEVGELDAAPDQRVPVDRRGQRRRPGRRLARAPGARRRDRRRARGARAAARRAARARRPPSPPGPGVVPSSSRSSERSSSNARSASAGLPAASWTSISSRCADSRNGAAAIAARAACSAAPSSRPPWRRPGLGQRLQRAQADRLQLAPLLGRPAALGVGQERLQVGRRAPRGRARRPARGRRPPSPPRPRGSPPPTPRCRPRPRPRGRSRSSPRPVSDAVAQRAAQLREQRAERGVRRGRRALGPQHVDQLVARAAAGAVQHEVREEQAALPPWQPGVQSAPVRRRRRPGRTSRISQPSPTAQALDAIALAKVSPRFRQPEKRIMLSAAHGTDPSGRRASTRTSI